MSTTTLIKKQVSRRNFLKAAAITTGAAALPAVLAAPASAATIFAQYNFEGNANDSSGNGRNGTLVNGPTFVTGRIGQAVDLAGGAGGSASQHVTLPTGIVSSLGDFSIAAWVKLDTSASWRRIFDFGTGTTANMFLTPTSGSAIRFAITTSGAGGEQQINGTAALPTGSWQHVCVTKLGNTGTLYVNGAVVGTNTSMTNSPSSLGNTNLNYIGRSQYSGDSFMDGQVDDFRIYSGALTAAEVSALYGGPTPTPTATATGGPTATPTRTPTPGTGGIWAQYNFDGNANDSSGGGRNGALVNGPTFVSGRISQAVNLDGTDDHVTLPTGIVSTLGDFSLAAWVKLDTLSAWARIFDFGTGTTVYMFLTPTAGSTIRFAITTNGASGEQVINGTAALPTGSWQHVCVTKSGNTGTLYVNAAQVGQNTSLTNSPSSLGNTNLNYIGRSQYADPYLDGQVDDFRIYSRALSASEVQSLYNSAGPTPTPGPTNTPTRTPTQGPTPVPGAYLNLMYPESGWRVNSTFWSDRIKKLITVTIPVHYNRVNNVNEASGGMDNFTQAARKLQGLSYKAHVGYWFSNAYPYNILQSMCRARMVDAQGDSAIISAQNAMLTQINNWIPLILSARESDGYLHTWTTLGNNPRWTDRAAHEGYTAGYFIEAAIAHYQMTNFTDPILFDAAKKLADCWYNNIGPSPKRTWWDGHQEMEMALTRFSRFCGALGDTTRANNYKSLAKFLLDSRQGGGQYDQSHALPINQTTAVGHAVRAMYMYAGMTDVAMLYNNSSYFNAVNTIWNNFVNRKYYVTGGVGSGETSEGFGGDYSLPNNSYCETCAGCGNVFFQHMLHLAYADGKYMDLAEEALYNNVVGTMDLGGGNYEYTNPLTQSSSLRVPWVTTVPCCAGNFPRTILTMPSWMYSKGNNTLYVNLFVGSTVTFKDVFGSTDITLTQVTNYPWDGTVTLTVSPSTPTAFTLYIRSPQRSVSTLYTHSPSSDGITSMTVNGGSVSTAATNGYVAINRTWTAGDQVSFTLPLNVQRIKAVSNIAADVNRVALQRGPIIFNIESADQSTTLILPPGNTLNAVWDGALLSGVYKITGTWSSGAALVAIPWYKRYNRGGTSLVWMRDA